MWELLFSSNSTWIKNHVRQWILVYHNVNSTFYADVFPIVCKLSYTMCDIKSQTEMVNYPDMSCRFSSVPGEKYICIVNIHNNYNSEKLFVNSH